MAKILEDKVLCVGEHIVMIGHTIYNKIMKQISYQIYVTFKGKSLTEVSLSLISSEVCQRFRIILCLLK